MADLALQISEDNGLDLVLENGDLALDESGLSPAVLVSLLSQARADEADVVDPLSNDPRGWWASPLHDVEFGSRLWQVTERARLTANTPDEVAEAARNALQWLIDDGVASEVEVTASGSTDGRVSLTVTIVRINSGSLGTESGQTELRVYGSQWDANIQVTE